MSIDLSIHSKIAGFHTLSVEEQIEVQEMLKRYGDPQKILLDASIKRVHEFETINGNVHRGMDKTVYQLKQGNIVNISYLLSDSMTDIGILDFFSEYKDVEGVTFCSFDELQTDTRRLYNKTAEGNTTEDADITKGEEILVNALKKEYKLADYEGIIYEPAIPFNDGFIKTEDGTLNITSAIRVHVVGIDEKIAKEPRNYILDGDRVEVRHEDLWKKATVVRVGNFCGTYLDIETDDGIKFSKDYAKENFRSITQELILE